MILAELVTSNGPSAPAWAFFSTLTVGVLAIIGQQLKARSDLRRNQAETERAKVAANKAAESAAQAEKNTSAISNGFAGRVDSKLDRIFEAQQSTDKALREHLDWHLRSSK